MARALESSETSSAFEDTNSIRLLVLNGGSPSSKVGTGKDRNELVLSISIQCQKKMVDFMLLNEVVCKEKYMRKIFDLNASTFGIYPTTEAQSKIVWRLERFEKLDLGESQRFFDTLSHEKYPKLTGSGLKTNLSFAVFQELPQNPAGAQANDLCILFISWHGPHKKKVEVKLEVLKELLTAVKTLKAVITKQLKRSSIKVVLAGDFNVQLRKSYGAPPLDEPINWMTLHEYRESSRRTSNCIDWMLTYGIEEVRLWSFHLADAEQLRKALGASASQKTISWITKNSGALDHDPLRAELSID